MVLKGKNIFIVVDNTMNRVVYSVLLKKEGCFVEFDRWGRDTIKILKWQSFDLIILDLMLLHGDSGFTIFEEIRKVKLYEDIPIIAISANDPEISIHRAQKMGFNGFIVKSLEPKLFPQQLEQIFAGENVWYAGSSQS